MILRDKKGFLLPDMHLSSLPTGAVKDLVNTLGTLISNGQYVVGDKIPMELELVAEHGVSRTVVRESIKVLSGKGLVRTARRYGTHVCEIEHWNLLDPDVIAWHKPESQMAVRIFADAAKFRSIIEPSAAALAAVEASPEQIEIIQSAAAAVEVEQTMSKERLAACFAFHASILDASNDLFLKQFNGFLHAILSGLHAASDSRQSIPPQTYVRVAAAIDKKDAGLAESSMRELLNPDRAP